MDEQQAEPRRVIIDTDPGIDDAIAILLAAASPEIQVEGVTVVAGNRPLALTLRNARALAEFARLEAPLACGCADPLLRSLRTVLVHGESGLGGASLPEPTYPVVSRHAVPFLIERIMSAPGQIDVVTLGPLTNLALALRQEPALSGAIRTLTVMGGALRVPGNVTPAAEFNVFVDPHAAAIVLGAGLRTLLVGLDVTNQARLAQAQVDRLLATAGPIGQLVADLVSKRAAASQTGSEWAVELHDPLALVSCFTRRFVRTELASIAVETASELTMGATVADFRAAGSARTIECATAVDVDGFLSFLEERLIRLSKQLAESVGLK